MELLCACRETLSSVCRLRPGESSNCSREGRVLKCSFCGWWHSWPDPCLSWGRCTSMAGEFGNSLFFRFQVKCRFPSPFWLYNSKIEAGFYVGAVSRSWSSGLGFCQSGRGWYCIIHPLCFSDGKAYQSLQGIVECLVSSDLVCHCASSCAESSGVEGARFCLFCRIDTRGSWSMNLIKIKPKPSTSFLANCSIPAVIYTICYLLLWLEYKSQTEFCNENT